MTNQKNTNWVANFFNYIREVIESAETPFSLFAIIVLPVLAPSVPATVTGIRLHTELELHWVICVVSGVTLELLGYVGAIAFIKAISRWFRKKGTFLSVFMTGISYGFYVVAMYLINVKLGQLSGEDQTITQVFAILSFLTVPTGLLAAEHINDRSEREDEEKRRQEKREDDAKLRQERKEERLERRRLELESSKNLPNGSGNMVESSNGNGNFPESSKKVPDWRKVRPTLSRDDLENLANLSPDQIRAYAQETGFTYKTISNWRLHAREELKLD